MAQNKSHRHYTRMNKGGRNEKRYANYRNRVGKPNGPGVPGNKAGKNRHV